MAHEDFKRVAVELQEKLAQAVDTAEVAIKEEEARKTAFFGLTADCRAAAENLKFHAFDWGNPKVEAFLIEQAAKMVKMAEDRFQEYLATRSK